MHQELLLPNILKLTKKVLQKNITFYVYCDRCYGKSVFQTIIVIVVIKIYEKQL